ncbi:glycosyltransferase [Peptoniphilus sp. KCTC 25270]|uniref:glycosyltransferase n=1 Tax=Peptoniphilus sp. KCTC 25270 TaxID=2897414 RepID=UPI001E2E2E27|nr:glycosyltransferase [Peptoniphilus sp. KCTC 25270]MCD1147819.1 glycosyltransferase [Peptoniphilus sp. KCTC 25270]
MTVSNLDPRIFVLLPCYNEEENIQALIKEWFYQQPLLKEQGYELLIVPVDDKSTDKTKEKIKEMESERVHPLFHTKNQNLGGVMRTGVEFFLENAEEEDLLVVMDGDNTHHPKYVQDLLKKHRQFDVIICSRYQKGASIRGLSKFREMLSIFAKWYYTLILRIPNVRDYTCGYRLYTREILLKGREKYGEKLIEQSSFACMMELLYKLHRCGAKISEVPFVLYYDQKGGESKMSVINTSKNSIFTALKIRREA